MNNIPFFRLPITDEDVYEYVCEQPKDLENYYTCTSKFIPEPTSTVCIYI